jgi:hypothetical protein
MKEKYKPSSPIQEMEQQQVGRWLKRNAISILEGSDGMLQLG